jgi:ferredoxin
LAERLPEAAMVTDERLPAASGPGAWLGALAMGASRIILLGLGAAPAQEDPLRLARTILAGLNLDPESRLLDIPEDASEVDILPLPAPLAPATWEPAEDERALLWQAAAHLHSQVSGAPDQTLLAPGDPFGSVTLTISRCTLCMACVGACPTDALQHGSPGPQIRFLEKDCTQCGRCRQVCPEQAVTLTPRICYDPQLTGTFRILHQDTPLRCSVCGAPFATAGSVAAVSRKLSAHWMYQDPAARARLKMCRDCRIRSILEAPQSPVRRGPAGGEK